MPASAAHFTVELAKEDFKFSAGHFTLFGEGRAEPLHGHNYRVRVRLVGTRLDQRGLLVDIALVKSLVRELCARLDDRVLLPAQAEGLQCRPEGRQLSVRCSDRSYLLPLEETLLLPLANTSVELLAFWLWEQLAPALADSAVETLRVAVEETLGQHGAYAAPLPPSARS